MGTLDYFIGPIDAIIRLLGEITGPLDAIIGPLDPILELLDAIVASHVEFIPILGLAIHLLLSSNAALDDFSRLPAPVIAGANASNPLLVAASAPHDWIIALPRTNLDRSPAPTDFTTRSWRCSPPSSDAPSRSCGSRGTPRRNSARSFA